MRRVGRGAGEPQDRGLTDPTAIDIYLRDLRRYPSLSREAQAEAFREMGRREVTLWAKLLTRRSVKGLWDVTDPEAARKLDPRRERVTAALALLPKGDPCHDLHRQVIAARDHLILSNLRLVLKHAAWYQRRRPLMLLEDVIQEGNLGLKTAVERFEVERGHAFSTYASWWIRCAITRSLLDKGHTIRRPTHLTFRQHQADKAEERLTAELGREPTSEEVAADLGCPLHAIELLPLWRRGAMSLDVECSEAGRTLGESIAAEERDVVGELHTAHLRDRVDRIMLGILTPTEERILRLRFDKGLTLEQIGDSMELSRERIRQIEAKALGKLRSALRRKGIDHG